MTFDHDSLAQDVPDAAVQPAPVGAVVGSSAVEGSWVDAVVLPQESVARMRLTRSRVSRPEPAKDKVEGLPAYSVRVPWVGPDRK